MTGGLELGPIEVISRPDPSLSSNATANSVSFGDVGWRATANVNGRYVVFLSSATDLDSQAIVQPEISNIYRHDRTSGETVLVSVDESGSVGDNSSSSPIVSDDGNVVLFSSYASNLVEGDESGIDLFVRDISAGTTRRIGLNAGPDDFDFAEFDLSRSGNTVVFQDGFQVYILDLTDANSARQLVSVGTDGHTPGNDRSRQVFISADGQLVTYTSKASNLVTETAANAAGAPRDNVFVWDRASGQTELASRSIQGNSDGNSSSVALGLSDDGTYLLLQSKASNIHPEDVDSNTDYFVYNTVENTLKLVTKSLSEDGLGEGPGRGRISRNGSRVVYQASSDDLVPNDMNQTEDVFVYDIATETNQAVSLAFGGTETANGFSFRPSISGNGHVVSWTSHATDLTSDAANGLFEEVYVARIDDGNVFRVSKPSVSSTNDGDSDHPFLSYDGSLVVFNSSSSQLVTGDANTSADVFAVELSKVFPTGQISLTPYSLSSQFAPSGIEDGAKVGKRLAVTDQFMLAGSAGDGDVPDQVFVYGRDDAGTPSDTEDDQWQFLQTLTPPGGEVDNGFGGSFGADGDFLVVAASATEELFAYQFDGSSFVAEVISPPGDLNLGDLFGTAIDIDGQTLVVSAREADSGAGAVYVYERSGNAWTNPVRLTASDNDAGDQFGEKVIVDGDRILVSARADDEVTADGGAVYEFRKQGDGSWLEHQKVLPPNVITTGTGMNAIAIRGNTLAVGSKQVGDSGVIFIYERTNDLWQYSETLSSSDVSAGADFGDRVAFEGDRLLVSARKHESTTGRVIVYEKLGGTWTQRQILSPTDLLVDDEFGRDLAVSGTLPVIAANRDDGDGTNRGEIRSFRSLSMNLNEGESSSFDVVLTEPPIEDVTLVLTVSDPAQVTTDVSTLTFTAANWNQPQVVSVTATNDSVVDGDQLVQVSIAANPDLSDNRYDSSPRSELLRDRN